jgi:TatD DNase family protein
MIIPHSDDYIDVHTHGAKSTVGIFSVENLMAHEERRPSDIPSMSCTFGIHPWYLSGENHLSLLDSVKEAIGQKNMIGVGEAGFDRLRGPSPELQRSIFESQAAIAEKSSKPVVVHCVRAWDELINIHRKLKPEMPWLVHGFRGKKELAGQLISRGMYISLWFDFVLRKESEELIRSLPVEKLFLETDGSDTDIRTIYGKVANDLSFTVAELKERIFENFRTFFGGSAIIVQDHE